MNQKVNTAQQQALDQNSAQISKEMAAKTGEELKSQIDKDSEVKLLETPAEASLEQFLELDEAKDEQEIINSFKDSLGQLDPVGDDELCELQLKSVDVFIPNPILTKYEQLSGLIKKRQNLSEVGEEYGGLFQASFELTEESLSRLESLHMHLNRSMRLFASFDTIKVNALNELIVSQMLDTNEVSELTRSDPKVLLFRVRCLKLGFKLTNLILTKLDRSSQEDLISKGVQCKLVSLVEKGAMSEPLRLKCLTCLNNSLQSSAGMRFFQEARLYERMIGLFDVGAKGKASSRLIVSLSCLVTQISFHEYLSLFVSKCAELFVVETKDGLDVSWARELCEILELVYAHCVRFMKLNRRQSTEVFSARQSGEYGERGDQQQQQAVLCETGTTEEVRGHEDSSRKRFKANCDMTNGVSRVHFYTGEQFEEGRYI